MITLLTIYLLIGFFLWCTCAAYESFWTKIVALLIIPLWGLVVMLAGLKLL